MIPENLIKKITKGYQYPILLVNTEVLQEIVQWRIYQSPPSFSPKRLPRLFKYYLKKKKYKNWYLYIRIKKLKMLQLPNGLLNSQVLSHDMYLFA